MQIHISHLQNNLADDVIIQEQHEGHFFQNQLDDPDVRAGYDDYWNSVMDSGNEFLPDL